MPPVRGRIEFRDIHFSYLEGFPVLRGVRVSLGARLVNFTWGETHFQTATQVQGASAVESMGMGGMLRFMRWRIRG